jgi:RHH-type transcriptional regulator, rel operon repressor / antitoxin RelB
MLRLTIVKQNADPPTMLGIRLEADMEARLERLARETGQTKSHLAREAIARYLDQQQPGRVPDDQLAEYLMALGKRHAELPILDSTADEDEIFGYAEMEGLVEPWRGD